MKAGPCLRHRQVTESAAKESGFDGLLGSDQPVAAAVTAIQHAPAAVAGIGKEDEGSPILPTIVALVAVKQSADVGGVQSTVTILGASIGTALAGAILIAVLTTSFLAKVEQAPRRHRRSPARPRHSWKAACRSCRTPRPNKLCEQRGWARRSARRPWPRISAAPAGRAARGASRCWPSWRSSDCSSRRGFPTRTPARGIREVPMVTATFALRLTIAQSCRPCPSASTGNTNGTCDLGETTRSTRIMALEASQGLTARSCPTSTSYRDRRHVGTAGRRSTARTFRPAVSRCLAMPRRPPPRRATWERSGSPRRIWSAHKRPARCAGPA